MTLNVEKIRNLKDNYHNSFISFQHLSLSIMHVACTLWLPWLSSLYNKCMWWT